MMTIKIYPLNGKIAFETVAHLPHDKGKYIAGFAISEQDAKRRAILYAGNDTVFIGPNAMLSCHLTWGFFGE